MESFKRRRSKTPVNKVISCPVVGNVAENRPDPDWAEEVSVKPYSMHNMLELLEQLRMGKINQLKNKTKVILEPGKDKHPISAENTHLQLSPKKGLEPEQGQLGNHLSMVNEEEDEETLDPQSVDDPSTHLTSRQEYASHACIKQEMALDCYDEDGDSSLAMVPTSSHVGEIEITESFERKCCSTEPFMIGMAAVRNRQDLLEEELMQLSSRLHSENSLIMECLQEQDLRYSQLVEQQHSEIGNMKEGILFMEEKMAYQSCKRDRDIWDELVLLESRLSRLEAEQRQQDSPVWVNEANTVQTFYNKVTNLLPSANTCHIVCGKVMMNLPVIVTILLLCLSAVFMPTFPLITTLLYTTLMLIILVYSDPLSWAPLSVLVSWVVTQIRRPYNWLMNEYDFRSDNEDAWELYIGG